MPVKGGGEVKRGAGKARQRGRQSKAEGQAKQGSKIKVYTVNNKTIYYANILLARAGCRGAQRGNGEEGGEGREGGRLLAVEPISSYFSRLTYENLNLRMQNGSWTRQHKTTQREE